MSNNLVIGKYVYDEDERYKLKEDLSIYSTKSKFDDDTWILDRKIKNASQLLDKVSIYFSNVNNKYKDITKYFILVRLSENIAVSTVTKHIDGLNNFYEFLKERYTEIELINLNKSTIAEYEDYLRKQNFAKGTKESYWGHINSFFKIMKDWNELPDKKLVGTNNPFNRTKKERMHDDKYIPECVINQMDKLFYSEKLPLEFRVFYWISRLIPSRVGEITPIDIECIAPYGNDYSLKLFMYKQNGGYLEPEIRMIRIKYENMGKHLIDLIRQQQQVAKKLQEYLLKEQQGYLFTYQISNYKESKDMYLKTKEISILNESIVGKRFRTICKRYNIHDENGNIYTVTAHMLRHNGITDRFYAGFSLLQIRDMTHHKTTTMIKDSYIHLDKEKVIEKVKDINGEKETIYFKGKIINCDDTNLIERLLKKPRVHKLGRLGICSDISGCKNDMFQCLDCNYFIPNADELLYYEEQVESWQRKVELFKNNQYMRENILNNLNLNKAIVDKIKNGMRGI